MGCASSKHAYEPPPAYTYVAPGVANGYPYATPTPASPTGQTVYPAVPQAAAVPDPALPATPAASSALHNAILRSLSDPNEAYMEVLDLLEKPGADANGQDSAGQTPLHVASALGLESLIDLLLEKGADVDATDAAGLTPLAAAAKKGERDAVATLAERGARVDAPDAEGLTPLVHAVFEGGNVEAVRELLRRGASANIAVHTDGTVLHLLTVTQGMECAAMEAVRHGADTGARDARGNTPLHCAARDGKASLVDFYLTERPDLASAVNNAGETPGVLAEARGHSAIATALGEAALRTAAMAGDAGGMLTAVSSGGGVSLGSPIDSSSNTALHYLAERGHSVALESLATAAPEALEAALGIANAYGDMPIHLAAASGNAELVQRLAGRLSAAGGGSAISAANADGLSALHIAAKAGHVAVAHELLNEAPALVVNGDEDTGNTALHLAALEGQLPMVELLLARGADVNARNQLAQTPLHLAASWNVVEVVSRLLECGADPVAPDIDGKTPLSEAAAQGHVALWEAMAASRLRRAAVSDDVSGVAAALADGASPDYAEDSSGDAVLHTAARSGAAEAIAAILSRVDDPGRLLRAFNGAGDAPLHVAARGGEVTALRALLAPPSADADLLNAEGETALHVACAEGWVTVVQELVGAAGATVDARSGRGCTALHDAACACNLALVEALLALGADPSARDEFCSNTPLHLIAQWGRPGESGPVAAALVAAGADLDVCNAEGRTPRDLAVLSDHNSVAVALGVKEEEEAPVAAAAVATAAAAVLPGKGAAMMDSTATGYTVPVPSAPNMTMMDDSAEAVALAAPPPQSASMPEAGAPMESVPSPPPATAPASGAPTPAAPTPAAPEPTFYPTIFPIEDDSAMEQLPEVPLHSPTSATGVASPAPLFSRLASPLVGALPVIAPETEPCIPVASVRNAPAPPPPASPFSAVPASAAPVGASAAASAPGASPFLSTGASNSPATSSASAIYGDTLLIPAAHLKYDVRAKLGQGSFGKVYRGTLHGRKVAIKILFVPADDAEAAGSRVMTRLMEDFKRELNVMAALRHDNVQDLRGYCATPEGPAIVSKYYARGSLAEALKMGLSSTERRKELTWSRRLAMAVDIAAGMMYLHAQATPLLHRDLKAINCFLDEHWRAIVGDFGLSKPMLDRVRGATSSGAATNPRWMAPELLASAEASTGADGGVQYTTKSDVFSMGCTLYELLSWRPPWYNTKHWEIINRVGRGERPALPARLPVAPGDTCNEVGALVALMDRCWAQDPGARPEFEEIHAELEAMLERHTAAELPAVPEGSVGAVAGQAGQPDGRVGPLAAAAMAQN